MSIVVPAHAMHGIAALPAGHTVAIPVIMTFNVKVACALHCQCQQQNHNCGTTSPASLQPEAG